MSSHILVRWCVYVIQKVPGSRNCSNNLQGNRAKNKYRRRAGVGRNAGNRDQGSGRARDSAGYPCIDCARWEGNVLQPIGRFIGFSILGIQLRRGSAKRRSSLRGSRGMVELKNSERAVQTEGSWWLASWESTRVPGLCGWMSENEI